MKITKQAEYAVVLMEELAKSDEGGKLSLNIVSRKRHLSYNFLRKIAHLLCKAGLIIGEEGQNGGYCLGKDSQTITIDDILKAVGESLVQEPCCMNTPPEVCPNSAICPQKSVLHKIQWATAQTYGKITLDRIAKGDMACTEIWPRKESNG